MSEVIDRDIEIDAPDNNLNEHVVIDMVTPTVELELLGVVEQLIVSRLLFKLPGSSGNFSN